MSLSFGGSSNSSSQKNTSTPNPYTTSLFNPEYSTIQGQINTPFTTYTGELAPGLSAGQQQATQMVNGAVGTGQGAVNSGVNTATGLTGYTPSQVNAPTVQGASAGPAAQAQAAQITPGSVGNVSAGLLSGTSLTPYLNPYQQDVINTTNQQIDNQRAQAINGQQGDFTKAGAFGGSREGVSDALTNKYYGQLAAQTDAGLNQQGYTQAQQAAQSDIANRLSADLANQGTGFNIAAANAGFGQGANLANQSATNNQNQFNAGNQQQAGLANQGASLTAQGANQGAGLSAANLGLGAAGLLGQLGTTQQGLALNDANAVNALGSQAQQTQAAQDAAAYQQYLLQLGYPLQQASLGEGLLGTIPAAYSGATTTGKGSGTQVGAQTAFKL